MSDRKTGSVALGIVFLTVFLDLVGFGIVLPLLPFYATELGASPFEVGLIIASYSAMQFLFAPIWGALSDRFGRRPLLLVGLFGSAASYVVFGLASTLEVLLLSRVIAGIMGANIPVAQAYIADSTSLEGRARGMGLIGAAFGLGFIFGPILGAGILHILEDVTFRFTERIELVNGLVFILVVLFAPLGIVGIFSSIKERFSTLITKHILAEEDI